MHSLYYSLTYYIKLVIIMLFYLFIFFFFGGGVVFFFWSFVECKTNWKTFGNKIRQKRKWKDRIKIGKLRLIFVTRCISLQSQSSSAVLYPKCWNIVTFYSDTIHYPRDYRSYVLVDHSTQKNVSLPPNRDQLWESSHSTEQRALSPLHDTPNTQDPPHRQNGSLLS